LASAFEKLETAARLLEEVTRDLDVDIFDVAGAKRLVDVFTRCERLSVAGRGRAARRVARAVDWKRSGHRNAAEWLASATGVSVGAAGRELETATKLEALPATRAAFSAGELSEAQAGEIAASAALDPKSESRLLATAREGASYRTVRDQAREVTLRARDDAAHTRWLHDHRTAHHATTSAGHVLVHAELSPDVGARVVSALEKVTDKLFHAARAEGRRELRSAYMADALAGIALGKIEPPPAELHLHAEAAPLARGYALPGERVELDGAGPISVTLARTLLEDARVTVIGHDHTGDITTVSSPKRTIPARLRRAVVAAYPACGRHGCGSRFNLQIDHLQALQDGGQTCKHNLWRLCWHCHHLKTHCGWQVVRDPDGNLDLVPPERPP
jgi:hypothetical protein